VCIDHRRLDAFVAQEFLDFADIRTVHQEVGCKAVSKSVRRGAFGERFSTISVAPPFP
jgi:hypothetical protein